MKLSRQIAEALRFMRCDHPAWANLIKAYLREVAR